MKVTSPTRSSFVAAACRLPSLYVFFFTMAVLGTVCTVDMPVRADSISNPLYDVTGTMTIFGNPVCGGAPCSETINFSFLIGESYNAQWGLYSEYVVPASISVSSFGALGSAFAYGGGINNPSSFCDVPGGFPGDANYMPFGSSGTGIFDLHACGNQQATPVVPSFLVSSLYSCGNSACVTDFTPPDQNGNNLGIFLAGSVQASVTAVPEGGSMLGYLLISLAPIGLAIYRGK